jgi:hypothetical protein
LLYKPYSPQVKTDKYRATGIPARIYHVELTAEVVLLCSEKEAPTTAGFSLQVQTYRSIPVSEFLWGCT